MDPRLLHTDIQQFIDDHLDADLPALVLKGLPFEGVEVQAVMEQIESKKRSQKKLPTWFGHKTIYYPNKLNIEQTSSETTARYKSGWVQGSSMIDLTGGFGVDSFYFSKRFDAVTHCEVDTELSAMAAHNFEVLNARNIRTLPTDGLQFLKASKERYDWIYVDPSRRHGQKGKVFFLGDCTPDVVAEMDLLFEHANNILIKTSPLLDLSIGIAALKHIKAIHIVAVNNEVKELLWFLQLGSESDPEVHTVNIKPNDTETLQFRLSEESTADVQYHAPLAYLYEPNAALLKAGAFNTVAARLELFKLHKHSHVYTSDMLVAFPGRRFQVEKVLPYQKKHLKSLGIDRANITTRNFPESVQTIRKALKIKDGGDVYLYFTSNALNEKIVIVASKIR